MAESTTNPSTGFTNLPSSVGELLSLIDDLECDLDVQRTVLISLRELPWSASREEESEAVVAQIAKTQRKLAEARRKKVELEGLLPMSSNNMSQLHPISGSGAPSDVRLPSRKRSIGSSNLDVDTLAWGLSKSRKTTPSPEDLPFGYDVELNDLDILDLTGDDETEWRVVIQRQAQEEARLRRLKEEADRDAAFAWQLANESGSRDISSRSGSSSGSASAFSRILGRPVQSSTPVQETVQVKQEESTNGPHAATPDSPKTALGSDRHHRHWDSQPNNGGATGVGSTQHTTIAFRPALPSFPRLPPPMLSMMPNQTGARSLDSSGFNPQHPNIPPIEWARRQVISHQGGSMVASSLSAYQSQSSENGQHLQIPKTVADVPFDAYSSESSPRSTFGKNQSSGANQPNFFNTDTYYHHSSQPMGPLTSAYAGTFTNEESYRNSAMSSQPVSSARDDTEFSVNGTRLPSWWESSDDYEGYGASTSLIATINRVKGYDFNTMLDADGKPLDSRLLSFLDDYVNDPRKTAEEIHQLLSNIRHDMEIPEEERGETPEALRYPLYPHQQLALKWMSDMEDGTNKGGILADDMGLGKTISTLALIASRQSADRNVKTNLIIGPVALIKQWEQEVKKKLKASHSMSVLLLHQRKKVSYSEIKNYDVVLTSYGLIASEWKQYENHISERIQTCPNYMPDYDQELLKKCPILHPKSKFYRVILDEAQFIKNKDTQSSRAVHQIQATYRWCLTGTPMMNSVAELYPLIRFLRIRPYNDFKTFQGAFRCLASKNGTNLRRETSMRKLQAVLKAIMLRRMKNSQIDGKPILTLPSKIEHEENVEFSEDERQFYTELETKSRVQFNKYLRAGTVGKNYSNILVLLLRLRQACCHPHLTEFETVSADIVDNDQMVIVAKGMDDAVVERIKTERITDPSADALDCPICFDAVSDSIFLTPCGHDTCPACFTRLSDDATQSNIRYGNEHGAFKCPICRGPVDPKKITNLAAFRKIHMPEMLKEEETNAAYNEVDKVADSCSDSESGCSFEGDSLDDEDDYEGNLARFVADDDVINDSEAEEDEDAKLDAEIAAFARIKEETRHGKPMEGRRGGKGKSLQKRKDKGKGKAKAEEIQPQMLTKLRAEASRNKDSRRRYMHYLRDNWMDSTKVTKVMGLLQEFQETDEKTIIFSQWTSLLDLLEVQIKYKLKLRYCRYTGDMPRNQRDEVVRDFAENPRNRVMLVSLRAGNAGLNLTMASRIIICDPFWNPYIEMQAVDRAYRIGQQRNVQVHRILVKETVEDRILALQEEKRQLVEAALDEGSLKQLGRLSERELAYLFGVGPRGG